MTKTRQFSMVMVALVGLAVLGCQSSKPTVRFPVVYLDMDGTILGSDHQIRPATISALQRYKACGGHYGIATGRTLEQVEPYLDELQPDLPIVLFNGAVAMSADGKRTLASTPILESALRSAVEAAKDHPGVISVVIQGDGFTMTNKDSERLRSALSSSFISNIEIDPLLTFDEGETAIKVLVFVEPAHQDPLAEKLRTAVGKSARVIVTSPEAVEVVAPGVNKANAISEQMQLYGYTMDNVLAFGDSGNDIEMLSEAALGVAMKNCRKEACHAAVVVTGDHNTDAIAQVIERAVITQACRDSLSR